MVFDTMSIFAYAVGLIFIYILLRIFIKPIKWLLKCLWGGLLGGLVLSLVNLVGGFAGVFVTVNPLTALISGFLGVPGVVMVILLQYILK